MTDVSAEVRRLAAEGRTVQAIRDLRRETGLGLVAASGWWTGLGLVAAKRMVDALEP